MTDIDTSNAPELLPCPFCGEAARVMIRTDENIWDHSQVEWTNISCGECDVTFDWPTHHMEVDGEPYSVTCWNNRPAITPAHAAKVLLGIGPHNEVVDLVLEAISVDDTDDRDAYLTALRAIALDTTTPTCDNTREGE